MLPLRLNRRFFTLFAVLMLCMSFLTITASAEANPPKDDVIIYTADPTEPKPTEAAPKPTTPKPTTPPKTEPPATTAPTTPTAVKPVEPFTEGNAIAKDPNRNHGQSHGTEQERNGQKDQAVLWGIRHQNRYAEDANNSTDQPEKHCGARDDTYADQRKQVDCQRDRGG